MSRRSLGRDLPIQVFQEPMQLDVAGGVNDVDDSDDDGEIGTSSQGEGVPLAGGPRGLAANGGGAGPSNNSSGASFYGFNVDNPTLDLEVLANSYVGLARIHRLLFIADHCSSLRIEALKMAMSYIKEATFNTTLYSKIYDKLADTVRETNSSETGAPSAENIIGPLDTQWIEQRSKKAQLKLEKLDADLKNYKSNSIKESIRRGHDDLGDHYLEMGDLANALKCYARSRDYCTSGKHVLNMCLNVIKVGIHLQNWTHVVTYVAKAEATPEYVASGPIGTKLSCAAGLADLATGKFKKAANHFLNAYFDHFHTGDSNVSGSANHQVSSSFADFLSPANVAIYGGLTALATFDRQELYKRVISSSSFKLFLELEPQLREALTLFYNSQYAKCLSILESIRDNLLLDLYLSPHVKDLYLQIRQKALVQYFSPYSSADMRKMAESFNTSISALEDEVMQLILDGQIQARIDSHNKILYSKNVDQRQVTFEKAMEMGQQWHRRTTALILRSAMLRHGNIQVRSPPSQREEPVGSVNNHVNSS